MNLPLHERALTGNEAGLVRLTLAGMGIESLSFAEAAGITTRTQLPASTLIPPRPLADGEQYRFHFDMTKCIGCRSCEVACNEQNGNPADLRWRRIGEIEGGVYPDTKRHYLSMGCNHCLDADCLKSCPVDAYKKDPLTGIVLHSADACIGCQYCVWNCPYSVPQFNPERGIVGKCDMCHGRLTEGLEPACVNACPEAAIEIEIVNMAEWRANYAEAESPGMPSANQTISTTRITLPEKSTAALERVDAGRIRPEHPHFSLVAMTTMIQCSVGSLAAGVLYRSAEPGVLTCVLGITILALNISVFHLGRPAYAWRALKMWRRSWLSREVALFGLFFLSTLSVTITSWITAAGAFPSLMHGVQQWSPITAQLLAQPLWSSLLPWLEWSSAAVGISGIVASAFIYLVPARPAWNMAHTPIDFLLSAGLLGTTLLPLLTQASNGLAGLMPFLRTLPLSSTKLWSGRAAWPQVILATLWLLNQLIRALRLRHSALFEARASAELLNTTDFRASFILLAGLSLAAAVLSVTGAPLGAFAAALGAVLIGRFLFFVTVVPLNMALTFVRASH